MRQVRQWRSIKKQRIRSKMNLGELDKRQIKNCMHLIIVIQLIQLFTIIFYNLQEHYPMQEEKPQRPNPHSKNQNHSPNHHIKPNPPIQHPEDDIQLSSLSISFEEDQFNRIYTRQLKKNNVNKAPDQGSEQINIQIEKVRENNVFQSLKAQHSFHRQERRKRRSRSRSSEEHEQRERSRSREKRSCNWHIYEICDEMDINNQRFQPIIRNLPIFKKKQEILHNIIHNQFVLVTGQTGCGKSTQVPRLLYEYLRVKNMPQKIICVQPRRLAVKNLHGILSKQIPEKGAVGYHISMQSFVNQNTKIVFMTNGIFLQRLIHSTQFFEEYPFIILDEVHERDIDTDFILLAIKRIIRNHPKVRIILMSATIDNRLFQYYFAEDEVDNFMKRQNYYKKYIRLQEQYQKEKESLNEQYMNVLNNVEEEEEFNIQIQHVGKQDQIAKKVEMQYLKSQHPCPTINVTEKNKHTKQYYYLDTIDSFIGGNNYTKKWGAIYFSHKYPATHKELYITACELLQQILIRNNQNQNSRQYSPKNTTVLIFLPGLSEIEYLASDIISHFGRKAYDIFQIVKCHSSILNDETMRKIHRDVHNKCKIIIATNIAESSITVPGVKYIIDFCLSKEVNFDQKSRMENLDLVWASKASCEQRAGRTGRVCDGFVIRLVEKSFYKKLKEYSTPEIQRSSLDRLILRIKLIHQNQIGKIFEDPGQVLGTALQPPHLKNIDEAIKSLIFCGGLKLVNNKIIMTEMGRIYVDIPLDIIYTKLLFFSFLMGTYHDILTLICILSQNKNAFRKQIIQKNPIEFFETISNDARCDFYALVQAFKEKNEKRNRAYMRRNQVELDIYYETQQLMSDIERRVNKKKLLERINYKEEAFPENEYKQRFKMTIAYGFLSQLMKIRGMIFDDKQQKRAKLMKKQNIQIHNTIILLNSDVIRKSSDHNIEADNKLKKIWTQTIARNFRIDPADLSITLGYGLSFLHCKKQTDLNKILFVKHMQKKKSIEESRPSSNHMHLTFSEMIRHLGDLDYMEEGVVSEYYKQQSVTIDNFSSNRIVSSNNPYTDNSISSYRLLISNCIMQQSSRLSCRYCSLLPDIPHLDLILHLIFYPFIVLLPDTKMTRYQNLYLKKRCKIKMEYELTDDEIKEANEIREIIHDLMSMNLFEKELEKESKQDIAIEENGDYPEQVQKAAQLEQNQADEIPYQQNRNQRQEQENVEFVQRMDVQEMIADQVQQKGLQEGLEKERDQKSRRIREFWPKLKQFITKQRYPIMGEEKWQQIYFKQMKIIIKNPENRFEKSQQREYMNPIKTFPLKSSYFSSTFPSDVSLESRVKQYENWKNQKLKQVRQLQQKVLCHDPFLVCSECLPNQIVKIAKLSRIGPISNQYYREIFEPVDTNVQQLPYNQLGDYFCSMLMNIYTEKQYNVFGCPNGHYLMIKFKDEKRLKILTFSALSIIYADDEIEENPDFESLEVRYWKEKSERAKERKLKRVESNYCFICNVITSTVKELQGHIRSQLHESNTREFALNVAKTIGKKQPIPAFDEDNVMY